MTERDEVTISDGPEKAHGDALQDVVEATPDAAASDGAEGSTEDRPA